MKVSLERQCPVEICVENEEEIDKERGHVRGKRVFENN